MDSSTFFQQLAFVLSSGPAVIDVGHRKTRIQGKEHTVDFPNDMFPALTVPVNRYRNDAKERAERAKQAKQAKQAKPAAHASKRRP